MATPLPNIALHPCLLGKMAEILSLEMLLYRATRNAEWEISCYGLSEDPLLAEQFGPLAVIIDSLMEQMEATDAVVADAIAGNPAISSAIKITSRRSCYRELFLAHRHIISLLKDLSAKLPEGASLGYIIEEALETHYSVSGRLNFYAREPKKSFNSCLTGPEEAAMLFI